MRGEAKIFCEIIGAGRPRLTLTEQIGISDACSDARAGVRSGSLALAALLGQRAGWQEQELADALTAYGLEGLE